ncbi:hypothetical protein SELMODRAFT_403164 [Selaginella moellendorffii]|uniref:Uncharacterized protein n=1 Tax=Selaginella moellendorffii TaxID=88036 RepID=D8QTA8_SELML|nr:hypothetical protein SELMODRAFT_403164 [Selaginella moellendorffii]
MRSRMWFPIRLLCLLVITIHLSGHHHWLRWWRLLIGVLVLKANGSLEMTLPQALAERSFPLSEEEYLLHLDDVANALQCWGATVIRSSLEKTEERPRIGKAVDESGGHANEWINRSTESGLKGMLKTNSLASAARHSVSMTQLWSFLLDTTKKSELRQLKHRRAASTWPDRLQASKIETKELSSGRKPSQLIELKIWNALYEQRLALWD